MAGAFLKPVPVTSRRAGAIAIVAAILAAAPALASADVLCVGVHPECPVGSTPVGDMDEAIGRLSSGDTLYVGSGSRSVAAAAGVPNVTIIGSGRTATTLTGPGATVLDLSETGTVVRDLAIHMTEPNQTGLASGGTVANVAVMALSPDNGMTGIEFGPGTTALRDSGVLFGSLATVPTVGVRNTGSTLTVKDTEIAAARGLDLTGAAGTTIAHRVNIQAPQGVLIEQGSISLGSSILDVEPVSPDGDVSYGLLAEEKEGFGEAQLSNVSVVGAADHALRAISHPKPGIQNEPMLVADSIYVGPGFTKTAVSVLRAPLGDPITGFYDARISNVGVPASYFDGQFETWFEEPGAQVQRDVRVWVPAAHVLEESGDLRPRPGSPLIDHGAAGPGPVWTTPLDFLGGSRVTDGDGNGVAARDIGALEYQPLPVTATGSKASATVGEAVTFTAAATDAQTYAWSFDDGATAAGAVATKAFTSAGRHVAVVTVTDGSGRTGTATVAVDVAQPAGGTTTTGSGGMTPGGGTTTDTVTGTTDGAIDGGTTTTPTTTTGGIAATSGRASAVISRTPAFGGLSSLRVRRNRVAVPVQCVRACQVSLVLQTRGHRPRTLGSVSERLPMAGKRTLSVRLTRAGAALLRRRPRTAITLRLTAAGIAPVTRLVTVRRG